MGKRIENATFQKEHRGKTGGTGMITSFRKGVRKHSKDKGDSIFKGFEWGNQVVQG